MKRWGPYRQKPSRRRRRAQQTGRRCPVTRKVSYLSYRVAAKAARSRDEDNMPYCCTHCGRWHVTSMTTAEYDRHQTKFYAVKEEGQMSFNEPAPASGDRATPAQIQGHLLIVWPVGYKGHVQTKHTQANKPSDCVVVDVVDLSQNADDGGPGKIFRGAMWFQSRLIQSLRPMIGNGPMLGTIQRGVSTNGMNPPWEFVSLTSSEEAREKAQAWLDAHPAFEPTSREAAEMERPAAPQQQYQGWPQGSMPAPAQQYQNQGPPPAWATAPQQPQQQWQPGPTQPTPPSQPQWSQAQQQLPPMPPQQPQPATPAELSILERLRQQQGQYPQQPPQAEQQQYGY